MYLFNGLPAARLGDELESHGCIPKEPRRIVEGVSSVLINGKPAARVTDAVDCGGTISIGSNNVFIGDNPRLTIGGDRKAAPIMLAANTVTDNPIMNDAGDEGDAPASPSSNANIPNRQTTDNFKTPEEGRHYRSQVQADLTRIDGRMQALDNKGFDLSPAEQTEYLTLNEQRNSRLAQREQIDRQLRQVTPYSDWTAQERQQTNQDALFTVGGVGAAAGMARGGAVRKTPGAGKAPVKQKLQPATAEHKADRWQKYQERDGQKSYDSWSKQYDTNMRNYKHGLQREADYREVMDASEGKLKTSLTNRQIDILKKDEMYAGQLKTGPVNLTPENALAIQKDAELVQNGWQVEHILEKGASKPYLEALDKGGIDYHIGPKIP